MSNLGGDWAIWFCQNELIFPKFFGQTQKILETTTYIVVLCIHTSQHLAVISTPTFSIFPIQPLQIHVRQRYTKRKDANSAARAANVSNDVTLLAAMYFSKDSFHEMGRGLMIKKKHLSHENNPYDFPWNTGRSIGIFIMAYSNP